ncbi:TolC family protein [Aureibaculum sp. 2210JD6-5]|uniref:TolC family protein n=1 Tax=Aureibaculum sp. 2210JD6-5 TaxID=3103957 RepID=UPI002AAEE4C7|nr:TolC family protein [Aureibaculum sp. 2210JD6-5]MDY7393874.1 TolC family protein [Aureibaculum sp. 2210JD6-5]
MTLKKHIIFFLFLLMVKSITAQKTWTLDECVAYAIDHNLELNNFKYTSDSNKETYRQSVRNLLPSITGSTGYNIRYGRSVNPNTNDIIDTDFFSNNYSLSSSIDIFRGFQKLNSIKASKLLYKAAKENVLQQKYLLAFRVMSAFYDIRFYEGLLAISKEQAEVSQTNYNLVKRQLELGLKAGADLYEAESVLLTDQLAVTQSKNSLEAAQLKLIQEMNLEGESTINISTALDEMTEEETIYSTTDLDSVYNIASNFIPLIKAEKFKTEAAKKEVAIARGKLYPSLSLSAGYGTGYYETNVDDDNHIIPFNTQFNDNLSKYVGVSLNIPIFTRWSNRSNIKQQKIELQRANNSLDIQKQELYKLIQQLVQDQKSFTIESEQSTKKMTAQELSFAIAQKKYEKGMISTIELYQAKNLYTTAQNENLQVKLQLKITEKTLDFYKGLPVFDIEAP